MTGWKLSNQPPNDLAAEQAALGSMLMGNPASVMEVVKAEQFYYPKHAAIYASIEAVLNAGDPVDAVTVGRELTLRIKPHELDAMGGLGYLITLQQAAITPGAGTAYARIVFDRWRQRQVIRVAQKLLDLGNADATTSDDVDLLLAQADDEFRGLGEPSRSGIMWDDLVQKWTDWDLTSDTVIHTPWIPLNRWFPGGGFHPGQLVIFGGRPGHGKSNAGLNVILGAAEKGVKSIIFSVEMDDLEVGSRLLSAGTYAKFGQIYTKKMTDETRERVDKYIAEQRGMPLEVVDQPSITVEQIVAHCRARRPKVIFVDYAQLIEATNNKLQREQQVAHITRSLKVAAKSLKMVVVVAAQLRRPQLLKNGDEPTPTIDQLRESGAVEQDADVIILLHRQGNSGDINMIVGKNRNGPMGTVMMRFRGDVARVGD